MRASRATAVIAATQIYIPCVPAPTPRHPRLATILSARVAYIAIILIATLTNLEPNWHDGLVGERLARAIHPPVAWSDTIDAIRNVLLFAGFGAIWEVTSRLTLRTALWRATLYGCLLSITVETLQLFSPVRFSSILDVMTNTGGAFIGAFAVAVLVAAVRARRDADSYLGVPTFVIALGLLGAVFVEGATPFFRQDYLPDRAGGPIHRLHLTLAAARPFSFSAMPWTELVLSMPAGFVAVAALAEFGLSAGGAAVLVAILGIVISVGAELAHGTTGVYIVWSAVVAHALGVALGGVAAALWLRPLAARFSGRARVRVFIAAYAIMLAGWLWRPFLPRESGAALAEQLSRPHWMPMSVFGGSGSAILVGDTVQFFLLFFPFGAVLGAWPARERGMMRWLMPGVWLALLLAFGQLFVQARSFDVTNLLIMIAGVWLGWWIARRAGIPRRGTWLAD